MRLTKKAQKLLRSVTAKRPRTVIDHILQHGQITTEELKNIYGYNHPPRAIRDVREHSIPIETFRVTGSDGRKIAAYRFGNFSNRRQTKTTGRTHFSDALKNALIKKHGQKCHLYAEKFDKRDLQIDHRIPFEIGGDGGLEKIDNFMLLCGSANRAKSWSCENCPNWKAKKIEICQNCYWAFPENYNHIAMREIRQLTLIWSGTDASEYEGLKKEAEADSTEFPEYVKEILRKHLNVRS